MIQVESVPIADERRQETIYNDPRITIISEQIINVPVGMGEIEQYIRFVMFVDEGDTLYRGLYYG